MREPGSPGGPDRRHGMATDGRACEKGPSSYPGGRGPSTPLAAFAPFRVRPVSFTPYTRPEQGEGAAHAAEDPHQRSRAGQDRRSAAASATSSSPPSPSSATRAGSRSRSRSGWPASACGTSTRSTSSASPGRTSRRRRAACSTSGNWIEFPPELTGVERAHRRPRRQVLPHRRAQGRRRLRLPGAAAGHRRVRPDHAEGGLALDRQLLPRRRLRLRAARLQGRRHPARGDEPRALRVAARRSAPTRSSPRPAPSRTSRRSTTSAGSCGRRAATTS